MLPYGIGFIARPFFRVAGDVDPYKLKFTVCLSLRDVREVVPYGCVLQFITDALNDNLPSSGRKVARVSVTEGDCVILIYVFLIATHSPPPDYVGSPLPEGAFL